MKFLVSKTLTHMSTSVEQIKSKLDIVTLISSYIPLERAGVSFKGKCPFHNEKTPSFFVSPERGNYYCFGCHVKGDIFTFVQEFEGIDFRGALKMLADRTGVVLSQHSPDEINEKEVVYSLLEQAVFFYQKKLSENGQAREYIAGRGVGEKSIAQFRIGFAPLEWRGLFEFLKLKGATEKDMLRAGLIKRKEVDPVGDRDVVETYYDTFRGRIMFPINDSSGRTVGFSGRILVPDLRSPKYLNSPETEVFKKSEVLFGLDKAKTDIRLKDYSILVEGQMDLVMMHHAGITNTVASSGTALSLEHLTKLRRLSSRIIMAFDGDGAGFRAADRGATLALSLGMELKIAEMPKGKDPADLAKDDVALLTLCIKSAKHIIDFYTDSLLKEGLLPREVGQKIKEHVLPYVAILPSAIEQAHFVRRISQVAFIKEEALWEDLKKVSRQGVSKEVVLSQIFPVASVGRLEIIERRLIGFVMWQRESNKLVESKTVALVALPNINIQEIEEKIRQILGERLDMLIDQLNNEKEGEKEILLFETENYYTIRDTTKGTTGGPDNSYIFREVVELLQALEEGYLKKSAERLRTELQRAEQRGDHVERDRLTGEYQIISQKINHIKNKKDII